MLTLTNRTVYVLSRNVENPAPDRRRRGNILDKIEVWPKGMLVYAHYLHDGYWSLSARGYYHSITPSHPGFGLLLTALEPAQTLDAVLYGAKSGTGIVSASEILEYLVNAGTITIEQVTAAIRALEQVESE